MRIPLLHYFGGRGLDASFMYFDLYSFREEMDVVVWFASVCELLWDWYCLCNYKCNKYEVS